MKLIKVKDGLLEVENFFLTSSFADFAGSSNVSRNNKELCLISNNNIERKFEYDSFVMELVCQPMNLADGEYCMLYFGNENRYFGIKEEGIKEQKHKFWKVIKDSNYIQAYISDDGLNYTNIGGMNLTESLKNQGFKKRANEDFILKRYKLYSNPYLTLQNFPESSKVELYNENNNLINTREFSADMECKIFLDGNLKGYLRFIDTAGTEIYKSDIFEFKYGDVYIYSPYNLEIIYKGVIVTQTAILDSLCELVTIKNTDTKAYNNLKVSIETASDDLIQLSLDGYTFTNTISISNIDPGAEQNIFIQIIKNVNNHNFSVRNFQLVIG